jgi:signal transduction histidine kinase
MANSKSITIQVDVEMGLTARVDKQMMATILRNLVSNSLKFTPAGGTILTSAHSVENGFRLTVTDTGVGMTPAQIDALFGKTANATTHGTEGESGSGLGLLLVHEFAQKHHASLTIDSELGRGTTFELLFPENP